LAFLRHVGASGCCKRTWKQNPFKRRYRWRKLLIDFSHDYLVVRPLTCGCHPLRADLKQHLLIFTRIVDDERPQSGWAAIGVNSEGSS